MSKISNCLKKYLTSLQFICLKFCTEILSEFEEFLNYFNPFSIFKYVGTLPAGRVVEFQQVHFPESYFGKICIQIYGEKIYTFELMLRLRSEVLIRK
jgi:hypothetical protein